ncbi:hypothetical protein EVAR_46971_1 [Eumeta japonica]|uniref:Uncharacterized protein n=1 Tax=Eumeta variegata TaxID=151549 RepID=A0A4C1X789_EUMVA|nr:hypothetical protein EVAR_46971_1 [Eumeta japonica]
MSNGWTDWDEIFYVYSNGSLDDFKTQLDPVGGAAVGISLKAFPGRTTSARKAIDPALFSPSSRTYTPPTPMDTLEWTRTRLSRADGHNSPSGRGARILKTHFSSDGRGKYNYVDARERGLSLPCTSERVRIPRFTRFIES